MIIIRYITISEKKIHFGFADIHKAYFHAPGDNEIRFMMTDENGNQSDVVTRNYKLNIKSDYSKEDAIQQTNFKYVMRGEIIDGNGTLDRYDRCQGISL